MDLAPVHCLTWMVKQVSSGVVASAVLGEIRQCNRVVVALLFSEPKQNPEGRMGLLRIARTPLVTVVPQTTVMEAVRTMDQESIGAVAVTDGHKLVGMFSERDLMLRVVSEKRDPERTYVREVMTSPVATIRRDSTADDALKVMLDKHFRHLPIVDRDDKLVGMISLRSLLHDKVEDLTGQLDSLEAYFTADGCGG
jgi:CBS domain-containing protein